MEELGLRKGTSTLQPLRAKICPRLSPTHGVPCGHLVEQLAAYVRQKEAEVAMTTTLGFSVIQVALLAYVGFTWPVSAGIVMPRRVPLSGCIAGLHRWWTGRGCNRQMKQRYNSCL